MESSIPDPEKSDLYLRWTRSERVQHWVLAASFVILVISGFALTYPESWWAYPFYAGSDRFDMRGTTHRMAATVYLALCLYHLIYLAATPRGRSQFKALRLSRQDFADLKQQFLYNLGKTTAAPRYGRFTYWEKFEYWALVWGSIVMVVTGLLLWFENLSLRVLPLWFLDLSTIIHFYEAALASLAIVVWHFYFVIFNPDVYPFNFSMCNGYLTKQEMEHEHALELATSGTSNEQNIERISPKDNGSVAST